MKKKTTDLIKDRLGHLAKAQEELEAISLDEKHQTIIREHILLGEGGYYSASQHGRKLMRSEVADGTPRLIKLAEEIEKRVNKLTGSSSSCKPLNQLVAALSLAMEVTPTAIQIDRQERQQRKDEEGLTHLPKTSKDIPLPFAPGTRSPYQILSMIVMKVFIDQVSIGRSESDDWPAISSIYQRIGQALQFEFKSAVCYLKDPNFHQELRSTWTRAHQTPVNKVKNINKAFTSIAEKQEFDLMPYKWSNEQRIQAAKTLSEVFVATMGLVELTPEKYLPNGKKDYRRVRPKADLLHSFKELMKQMSQGKSYGYPMIEAPQEWTLDDPNSGGYYSPALRELNPVVRNHAGEGGNNSTPSQSAIDLLNTLGRTCYRPDHEMMACFEWAVENAYEESGLPLKPSPSVIELDDEGMEHNRRREAGEIRWEDGSVEVQNYKVKRKEQYKIAVDQEAKFYRTIESLSAIKPIKKFDALWFSWSCDYRGRKYPQQTFLHPQSSSAEKSLLRYREGEQITTKAQRDAINEAIGVAWKGNKMSLDGRREFGKQATQQLLPLLTNEPNDLSTIIKAGAKDPWDLLKILYCYKRWDQDDALWDVGLGLDASQSGLQLLSGMILDPEGLTNTNVLLPADYTTGDGPVDGYMKVIGAARKLVTDPALAVELMGLAAAEKLPPLNENQQLIIRQILWHDSVRDLGKSVVLPLPYGSTWIGTRKAVAKVLKKDLGIDLTKWGEQQGYEDDGAWKFHAEVLDQLTHYLRAATRVVFPQALELMDWLRALAATSIKQQVANNEFPKLNWQTHDGFNIKYWSSSQETIRVVSTSLGEAKVATGDNMNKANTRKMISAFAPNVIHALDAALLREAFKDWKLPITAIHDCVTTLPSGIPLVRQNIKEAFITVCEQNTPARLAEQMNVSMEKLPPIVMGAANLRDVRNSEFMFH